MIRFQFYGIQYFFRKKLQKCLIVYLIVHLSLTQWKKKTKQQRYEFYFYWLSYNKILTKNVWRIFEKATQSLAIL